MAASTSGMQNFENPLPTEGRPHTAQNLPRKQTVLREIIGEPLFAPDG